MLSDQQQQQRERQQQQQKCKLCKFQCNNQYVFRAHIITEHGLGSSVSGLGGVDETTFLQQFIDYHQTSPSLKSFEQREKYPIDSVVDDEQREQSEQSELEQKSEIFCNICMKEFCSKYFLQIHRQNIHGIFVDNDDNISDSPPTQPQLSPSSNHQSTTTTTSETTTTTTTTKSTTSTTNSSFLSPALLNSFYQQAGMKTSESTAELENLNLALSQVFGRQIKSERSSSSPRSNSSSSSPSPRPDQKTKNNSNSETTNNNND
uniref:GATA zinc finger domain-containing protein 18-like n=1 Tax=Dermatophagoides pteronyssinus TaxID=6956 RepID=A0A6P6XUE5_DERPT